MWNKVVVRSKHRGCTLRLPELSGYQLGCRYCAGGFTVSCPPHSSLRDGNCDCPHFTDEENEVQ